MSDDVNMARSGAVNEGRHGNEPGAVGAVAGAGFAGAGFEGADEMHPMPGMEASLILRSAHKIAIAGLGLIGGSLALRLAERGRFVVAWNHNDRPYEAARSHRIRCVDSLEELAAGKPDVLVLATPLAVMPEMLARLAPVISPSTTLTDVGSVKAMVRRQVEEAGLADCYVGAHPMAGNERSGFAAADSKLFDGALWALSVEESTSYDRYLTVADMVTQGVGNAVITLNDEIHDASAAMISHMPHVVSTALSAMLVDSGNRNVEAALAAGSWRDMTRVSLTDPDRTMAMVEEDAVNVSALLREMAARLGTVADSLEQLDGMDATEASVHGARQELRRFFQSPEPFRAYNRRESDVSCPATHVHGQQGQAGERDIVIPKQGWQGYLLGSAQSGERVIRFTGTHAATVVTRSL